MSETKSKKRRTGPVNNGPLTDEEIDKLSPILRRMYCLLMDGNEHQREELWQCLDDPIAPISYIYQHITRLRKVLIEKGTMVSCDEFRAVRYSLTTMENNDG